MATYLNSDPFRFDSACSALVAMPTNRIIKSVTLHQNITPYTNCPHLGADLLLISIDLLHGVRVGYY